jgi:adenosylcobinamide-phosphate synthase
MWGYKTEKFLYFGRFVARFDDVLNYIPARFTAYGFALCVSSIEQSKKALACWKSQAKLCSSPNGGPVMTAGAGALNVRLSSGGYYVSTSATTSTAQQNKMQVTAALDASVEWHEKPVMGCGEPAQMETIMASLALVQRTLVLWLLTLGGIIFVF